MITNERISWADFTFWGKEKQYVDAALASTWLSGGEYVSQFEQMLARDLELPNAFAVANGTVAIQLCYHVLDIGPGDEVIVPAFGFMAAANVLKLLRGVPVFADIDRATWCMDVDDLERKVGPRTRAILVIHNYGVVANMPAVQRVARKHGLFLIEDCAESIFSRYQGRYGGTFGDLSTFSFHATKTVSTGEGGMVCCRDPERCDRLKLIRSHGLRREKKHYWHEYFGNNFRLSNVLAAIGLAQLEQRAAILAEKARVLARYRSNLATHARVRFQPVPELSEPVIWAIAVQLDLTGRRETRDDIIALLAEKGIECRPGFYTPDQLDLYRTSDASRHPVANQVAATTLVLPSSPRLADPQIDRICAVLGDILGK